MRDIASVLGDLIQESGVPISELDTRMGESEGSVAKMLNSGNDLAIRDASRIVEALGIPESTLYRRIALEDSPARSPLKPSALDEVTEAILASVNSSSDQGGGQTRRPLGSRRGRKRSR